MNAVFIIGNVCKDLELKQSSNGKVYCHFCVAVARDYASGNGEKQTDYFNLIVWNRRAELCAEYLKKGSKVAITGSLENRVREDKDGNRLVTNEINVSKIEFLFGNSRQDTEEQQPNQQSNRQSRNNYDDIDEDQLPF